MLGRPKHHVPQSRIALLRGLPIFAHLSEAELARVDGLVDECEIEPGAVLAVQGRPGREAFIVLEGEADIRVDGAVIYRAGPGDVVGEMSLLDNQPRSATVVAAGQLRVLVLDPRHFSSLMQDPRTAAWLASSLSQRLRQATTPA